LLTEECFETFFEGAAEAGADDVEYDEASNSLVVVCGKTDLSSVTDAVRNLVGGFEYEIVSSEITFLPKDTVIVPEDDETFLAVLDVLEDLDDVQNVYHNGEV
jgi:transcriptional/translational regulatory protein YebC/TACO1